MKYGLQKMTQINLYLLDCVLTKLVDIERYELGRSPIPSILIVDSKTIQDTDCAEEKVVTAVKKLGVKLHIGVDVLGLPYESVVTTANINDRDGDVEIFL